MSKYNEYLVVREELTYERDMEKRRNTYYAPTEIYDLAC